MALSSLADDLSPSFSARFRRRSWSCTDGRRLSFGHLDTAERYCRPMPYAEFTCQQRSCRHSRFQDTYVTYHHSFRHCHQSQTFPSSWRLNHRTLVCRTPRSLLPHLHLEPSAINAASWRELEFNHPKKRKPVSQESLASPAAPPILDVYALGSNTMRYSRNSAARGASVPATSSDSSAERFRFEVS